MMSVAEQVRALIAKQLEVEEGKVVAEASLIDDLGADSLDAVELVMAIEEEFGLEIPDEEAEQLQRVGEVIRYVEARAPSQLPATERVSGVGTHSQAEESSD
ncbi:MAG: acyl carrier protein [Candidatus Omnitrophica bacterium]|nr:acyl carrier protein [Candidatus Omnitrophota bacterium]